MALSDGHRFPFSLLAGAKFCPGDCKVDKTGMVSEEMDKDIGRPVIKISGSVSANNYIEYDNLNLVGEYLYIQMKLLKSGIATIHLEILTTSGLSMRISLSTLYNNEIPRFMGRSLRLAIPKSDSWMILVINVNGLLEKYSTSASSYKFKSIRKIQLCSSMLLRDVVTSDQLYGTTNLLPKELAIKIDSRRKLKLTVVDILTQSEIIMPQSAGESATSLGKQAPTAVVANVVDDSAAMQSPKKSSVRSPTKTNPSSLSLLSTPKIETGFASPTALKSPQTEFKTDQYLLTNSPDANAPDNSNTATYSSTAVFKTIVPETPSHEKVLSLQRLLHYSGNKALLLYDGKMIVQASGRFIVLVDAEDNVEKHPSIVSQGLWRAFTKGVGDSGSVVREGGFRQAFLKGHSKPIAFLEVSSNGAFLASCESGPNSQCIIWNIKEGKRVATIVPHSESVTCLAFNAEGTMLVTVGQDAHHRLQLIVWDVQLVIIDRIGHNAAPVANAPPGLVLARQLSDFAISKITFSPFEENTLVSCGRENIRFYRIKKGHLPGRPVLLNEYARGFQYSEIAFDSDAGLHPIDPRRPVAYFASNKGLLLKVDYMREQVLCAYQLHNGAISSLAIYPGYCVTGGSDCRLRVWPLDFSDFQLEAHHEGSVSNIHVSADGRRILIGTSVGTLGILDINEQSYNTISRSHAGEVLAVFGRGKDSDEFVSLGVDKTIRLWDVMNGQQRYEFTSSNDQPRCAVFDPRGLHTLICGFESGYVRIFDVDSTATICEHNRHSGSVVALAYTGSYLKSHSTSTTNLLSKDALYLVSAGLDGFVVTYDVHSNYNPIKSVCFADRPIKSVHMAVDSFGQFVAVSADTVSTVVVFAAADMSIVYRNGRISSGSQVSQVIEHDQENTAAVTNVDVLFGAVTENPSDAANHFEAKDTNATSISATVTSSSNISSSMLAPVVGLSFINTTSTVCHLMLLTDKHITSLPISTDMDTNIRIISNKKKSAWEARSTRRFPYGIAHSMTADVNTGLYMIACKSGSSVGSNLPTGIVSQDYLRPDAFVIMGIKVKATKGASDKLLFSKAQLYREHAGVLTSLCACSPCGRLVSVDNLGCIALWNINGGNLHHMLSAEVASPGLDGRDTPMKSLSSMQYSQPITPYSRNATPRTDLSSMNAIKHLNNDVNHFDSIGMLSESTNNGNDDNNNIINNNQDWMKATQGLTDAFEKAVENDPSAWSAKSDVTQVPLESIPLDEITINLDHNLGEREERADEDEAISPSLAPRVSQHYEINDSDDEDGPQPRGELENHSREALQILSISAALPAAASSSSSSSSSEATATSAPSPTSLMIEPVPFPVPVPVPIPAITIGEVRQSETESTSTPSTAGTLPPTSQFSELLNSDSNMTAFSSGDSPSYWSLKDLTSDRRLKALAYQRGLRPITETNVNILSLGNTVAPSLCLQQKAMAVTDGTLISVKSIDSYTFDSLLRFPGDNMTDLLNGLIVSALSMSPSGLFVAAVMSSPTYEVKIDSSTSCYLLIWMQEIATGQWKLITGSRIHSTCSQLCPVTGSVLNGVCLDWTHSDWLLVAVPSTSQTNEDVSLLAIPPGEILQGTLAQTMHSRSLRLVTGEADVCGLRVLHPAQLSPALLCRNSASSAAAQSSSIIYVALWSQLRLNLVAINSENNVASLLWTNEIGPRGPYLSLDVAPVQPNEPSKLKQSSKSSTFSLFVGLDSLGGLRVGLLHCASTANNKAPSSNHKSSNSLGSINICKAVDAHLPAAHAFGKPKQLSLSPLVSTMAVSELDQSFLLHTHLVLASTKTLRIFSLRVKNGAGKPLSVTLSLLQKVSNDIIPDFLYMLSPFHPRLAADNKATAAKGKRRDGRAPSANSVPDILVFDKRGNSSLIQCTSAASAGAGSGGVGSEEVKSVENTLLRGPLTVQSKQEEATVQSLSNKKQRQLLGTCPEADLLIAIVDGSPHLYDRNGLEVEFINPLEEVTAVATTDKIFVLGYASGRFAVFNATTKTLIYLSPSTNNDSNSSNINIGQQQHGPITSLLLLHDGTCVIALHQSGAVYCVPSILDTRNDFVDGGLIAVPLRDIDHHHLHHQSEAKLVACAGDHCMFGVLRYASVLEVYRVSIGYDKSALLAPIVFGLLRNFNDSYSQDIQVTSSHLIRNGNWLVIALTGKVFEAPVLTATIADSSDNLQQRLNVTQSQSQSDNLFVGSLNMLSTASMSTAMNHRGRLPYIVVHQRAQLLSGEEASFSWDACNIVYQNKYCLFTSPFGVFALNLLSACVAKSTADCLGITEHMIAWRDFNVGNHGDWSHSAITAAVLSDSTSYQAQQSLSTIENILNVNNEGTSSYFPEQPRIQSSESTAASSATLASVSTSGGSVPKADSSSDCLHVYIRRSAQPTILHFVMRL